MNQTGTRPKTAKPAVSSAASSVTDKKGLRQALRVLAEDGRIAAPSVLMPRAKTELTELLAGDGMICVRRPAGTATAVKPKPATSNDAASASQSSNADPDLARLNDAWPALPRTIRAGIMAIVRETTAEA